MRFYTVLAVRPSYYDRGAIEQQLSYNNTTLGPHASTVVASYVVPTNRKCFGEFAWTRLYRVTVATTPDQMVIAVRYTPAGGAASTICEAVSNGNTVGTKDSFGLASAGVGLAGDTFDIATADASTGGTAQYNAQWKGTEFAA